MRTSIIMKGQKDALAEARDLLQEPSRDTKRKILVAINLIIGFVLTLHMVAQLATVGHMPVPERDNVIFPLIIFINFGSALYNVACLLRRWQASSRWDALTAWTTVIFLQLVALTLLHSSSNTALSLLADFNFSVLMIFFTGFILNRRAALVWWVVVLISVYFAIKNRGAQFDFILMTSDEAARLKALMTTDQAAFTARMNTAVHEKLAPISIVLIGIVFPLYSLFAILGTYFEAGMIGQVLKAIPNAIDKIQIASEEKQKLEQENVRMGAELDVAQRIQAMILPKDDELKKCEGLDVAAKMVPASEVGGDLYDVLPQKDGSTALVIGDVTDHGLASGLVMLMAQSSLRLCLEEANADLLKSLQFLNNMLYKNVQTRMNDSRTLTLALLHYKDGLVRLAGQHESVVVLRKGQTVPEEIETGDFGTVVGMIDDIEPMVAETSFRLDPGDCMVLYTDGATEAENPKQEQYGIDRVKQSLVRAKDKPANEIVDAIFSDLKGFIDTAPVYDDITLVVIRARE